MALASSSTSSEGVIVPLEELIERVLEYQPAANIELLRTAYHFAVAAHEGQKRKSGAPFFAHPASVARVIASLRLDMASICAGLLHDVVEDTPLALSELEKQFGSEVAFLVDGVTKLSKINFSSRQEREAENFRKMLVAMTRDIRVLLVKICDRVDNMRTLEFMSMDAQERIARETMEIYAPLASRLGIQRFKCELEDLSFKYLEPAAYSRLFQLMAKTEPARLRYMQEMSTTLGRQVAEHGFAGEVEARQKHLFSVQRKMVQQKVDFEQVHDLISFRVIVESVSDCYGVMGAVHARYTPVPGRIKDYIALPKPNMYQSLHTTVIGPGRERIEVQVRTREMHRVSEEGIAAHWRYRDNISGGADPQLMQRFAWLRELVEFQRNIKDPAEFIESVKVDLFQDEVYVFTPKGDMRVFPRGATILDFAYSIHTEIGHQCSGSRANGIVVPLKYKLRNGDVIEITTTPGQRPRKEWILYAATSRARNRIRATLRDEERDRALKLGRELLDKELHTQGISLERLLKTEPSMQRILSDLGLASADDLFAAIGYGKVATAGVTALLVPPTDGVATAPPEIREGRIEALVRRVTGRDAAPIKLKGDDDVLVRYSRCCRPLPGDEIVGFITRGRGIAVHRRNCPKSFEADPARRVIISWDARVKSGRPAKVRVLTANRPGMLGLLGQTFSDQNLNITALSSSTTKDDRSVSTFTFPCADLAQLKGVMRALHKLQGVYSVERV